MENYQKVHARFEEEGCTLLTSFEEFEELSKTVLHHSYQFVRVRFIGTCTHESHVVYTNFNLRKTGKVCRACMTATVKKDLKKKNKNANEIEYEGIKIIEEYLTPFYEVVRTKEGCLADFAIRKKGEKEDQWIPVQVKTTMNISHGMYSFTTHNTYKDMLLICICISEKKIWIMPYNALTLKSKLNISVKSKYSKYLVDNTIIDTFIDKYVKDVVYNTLEILLKPVHVLQQREQEYVKKRETCVPFLSYHYPEVQGTCVDVIINGKKVQEKVLGFTESKKTLQCTFSANNGKVEGKRTFRMYHLGENDYYWLHSSIDDRFWIIPENIIYEKGHISKKDEVKSKKTFTFKSMYSENTEWLKEYEFSYNNVNQDGIMKIFG
jgi:hypothetical protein